MAAPRVLVSDKLSKTAVQIFKDRGVEVDYQPDLGKDKEKLLAIIGDYDGLAIRSATKVTEKLLAAAKKLRVIGRAGIGVDNVDVPAATAARHHRDEHAVRQFDHHRRARHRHDVRGRPPAARRRRLDPGRQVGKEPLHGRRDHRQDARHHRLRQYRLDRRRARHRPEDARGRLRSVSVRRARRGARRREGRARRTLPPRRLHHPAHAADRQDPQHHRRGGDRQDEGRRAHHQLRPRRPRRRGGPRRGDQDRQGRRRRRRRVRHGAGR